MQQPAHTSGGEHQGKPQGGLIQARRASQLQGVEGAPGKIRDAQEDDLRADQKYDRPDKYPTLATQELP
jgi:hypothetical protein